MTGLVRQPAACRVIAACTLTMLLFIAQAANAAEGITLQVGEGLLVKLPRPAAFIMVADSSTADVQAVSSKLVFIRAKKIGVTSFYAVNDKDETILKDTIKVTYDMGALADEIKQITPTADVNFHTFNGGVVMQGYAKNISDAEQISTLTQAYIGDKDKLVNMIKTSGSDQVMLKVKIVEMARNDLKTLGINLQNAGSGMQLLQGNNILHFPSVPSGPDLLRGTNVIDRGVNNTDTSLFLRYKDLNAMIDALETQGLANILAEPALTTTTGKAASFLAGGQFPIPVVQPGGNTNLITIEYKPFGVSLNFTPVVMGKDRISITVAPEVSTLNFDNPIQVEGITYPILDTRKASAVVELGSGDSFMLAGLLQNETSNNIAKLPGIGNLPVLGALFRSQQFQNNETDLVIIVTPYIVHPVAEASLQTPLDGYTPPSDLDSILYGNLYQQQPMPQAATSPLPPLHNEGGFDVQ